MTPNIINISVEDKAIKIKPKNNRENSAAIMVLFGPKKEDKNASKYIINTNYKKVVKEIKKVTKEVKNNIILYTFGDNNTKIGKEAGYKDVIQLTSHPFLFPKNSSVWWMKHFAINEALKKYDSVLLLDFDTKLHLSVKNILNILNKNNSGPLMGEMQVPLVKHPFAEKGSDYRRILIKNKKLIMNSKISLEKVDCKITFVGSFIYYRRGDAIKETLSSYKDSYNDLGYKLREEQQMMYFVDKKFGIMDNEQLWRDFDPKIFLSKGSYSNGKVIRKLASHKLASYRY